MALDGLLIPWAARAYRHIPEGSRFDVFDLRFSRLAGDNRWNYPGQPTLYLAGDRAVAIAQFARHIEDDRASTLARLARSRQLYRLALGVERLLDLRDHRVLEALSIANAPACFLRKDIARATANFVRAITSVQAILVPSVAFLDQPERWVAVLFLDKLPADPHEFVTSVQRDKTFRLGA